MASRAVYKLELVKSVERRFLSLSTAKFSTHSSSTALNINFSALFRSHHLPRSSTSRQSSYSQDYPRCVAQFHCSATAYSSKDWYSILGLPRDADQKDIKQSYFKLAKLYHPDSHPNDRNAKEKFQEVSEAYDVLSDDDRRRDYDAQLDFSSGGRSGKATGGAFRGSFHKDVDPEELFDRVFGKYSDFASRDSDRGREEFVSSREISVNVTFVEAARGVKKNVDIFYEETCARCDGQRFEPSSRPVKCHQCAGSGVETISRGPFVLRQTCRHCHGARSVHKDPCTKCKGKGKVTIKRAAAIQVPAGVEDGQTIRTNVDGKEYFLHFTVEKSKKFRRTGSDIHSDVQISLSQAILGGVVRVNGLYDDYRLNVPSGTQSHEYILLKGKGMKRVNSSGHGDHYVHVRIRIPSKMTPEQLALISVFAESENDVEGTINGLTEVTLKTSPSRVKRRVVNDDAGFVSEIRRAVGWQSAENVDNVGG